MKLSELFLLVLFLFSLSACVSQQPDTKSKCYATEYVNPFIGTDFTGNTYPGAQTPFGMVQLSPDNGLPGWDRISGYFYPDSTIPTFQVPGQVIYMIYLLCLLLCPIKRRMLR